MNQGILGRRDIMTTPTLLQFPKQHLAQTAQDDIKEVSCSLR
jgi:hypothetical protein